MKQLLPLLILNFVLGLVVACSKHDKDIVPLNAPVVSSNAIDKTEAINNLNQLLSHLQNIDTKSGFQKSFSEESVYAIKEQINDQAESDTLLYVANFDNDEGFAVMAASRQSSTPVLCITEKGHLSETLFSAANRVLEEEGEESDSLWIPLLLLQASKNTRANGIDPGDPGANGGGGPGGVIGPFLHTKWGQDMAPYDSLTPNSYPAGCAVIAVAQIMAAEQYSSSMVFNGVSCAWNDIKTVHSYPNEFYGGTTAGRSQVANFIYELGKSYNCNITYGATGSPGSIYDARNALINYGYSNVTVHGYYNSFTNNLKTIIDNQLYSGHPVYCRGARSGGYAHAWVIDGGFIGLYDLYHINWGWDGDSDGYYACGVFDTSQRNSLSSIDSGGVISGTRNYTYDFAVITYSL